jgi:ATP-dependent DNA helicase RecQ
MNLVAFFDIETNAETGKILDIGCIRSDEARFHKNSIPSFKDFIKDCKFICGHNILQHDLKYLKNKQPVWI